MSNSVLHHGIGMAVQLVNSGNISLVNNTLFDFVKTGINTQTVGNVTIRGNWVVSISSRKIQAQGYADNEVGIYMCALRPLDKCPNLTVADNVVAGINGTSVDSVGYVALAHQCGQQDSQTSFRNNVAHSILGYGATIFMYYYGGAPANCIAASHFAAYKCSVAGIVSTQPTRNLEFSNLVMIDNQNSACPVIGSDGDDLSIKMFDSVFYGETDARDCDS